MLPQRLRSVSSAIFGTDFADVRIHVGPQPSRIGARAFAFGHDLYFAPGQYAPDTREGLLLLGHELAHVIQQGSGRVRGTGRISVVQDPLLEEEAAIIGQCFAEAVEHGRMPERPVYALESNGSPISIGTIQCLMDFEAFKTASSASGMRNKIATVDNALKEYHRLNSAKQKDWAALLRQIRALYESCKTYSKERPNSDRQAGVDKLSRQIATEEPILMALAEFQKATTLDDKWEHLEKAQERYLTFRNKPDYSSNLQGDLSILIGAAKEDFKKAATGSTPILRDLEELKKIAASPLTPGILKSVILEVTAANNVQNLSFSHDNPKAKYNVTRGAATKYTLCHALDQALGKIFRLGSLLHELTHVCIAETFSNTVIMLSMDPAANDDEIMRVVNIRKTNITALQSLVENAPLLELGAPRDAQGLTEEQKKELIDKAGYATGIKMSTYMQVLQNFPKATNAPAILTVNDATAMYDRLMKLVRKGLASELVEYDTVINQMTLWCHLWKLDLAHPVYDRLRDLTLQAYIYRGIYRLKKKGPPRKPLPIPPTRRIGGPPQKPLPVPPNKI